MDSEKFDFGAMVDSQLSGIRKSYKFGKAFNDDKLIVRPKNANVGLLASAFEGIRL